MFVILYSLKALYWSSSLCANLMVASSSVKLQSVHLMKTEVAGNSNGKVVNINFRSYG